MYYVIALWNLDTKCFLDDFNVRVLCNSTLGNPNTICLLYKFTCMLHHFFTCLSDYHQFSLNVI